MRNDLLVISTSHMLNKLKAHNQTLFLLGRELINCEGLSCELVVICLQVLWLSSPHHAADITFSCIKGLISFLLKMDKVILFARSEEE